MTGIEDHAGDDDGRRRGEPGSSNASTGDPSIHSRTLRFRRRDDYAVELFREALGALDDVTRVRRILVELGRFYNPYIDAPIVDAASRRAVLESLEQGDADRARRVLEDRLAAYARPGSSDDPPPPDDLPNAAR